MTKHTQFQWKEKEIQAGVHPVWRGIGFFLLLIFPVLSYAAADLLVEANRVQRWVAVPMELARTVTFPLTDLSVEFLGVKLLVAAVLTITCYFVLAIFYSVLYRVFKPPPDPLDAPPMRRRGRRR